jgi:hypothetical protein
MRNRGPFKVVLNDRWIEELAQKDIDCALRIAGDLNERYGYCNDHRSPHQTISGASRMAEPVR